MNTCTELVQEITVHNMLKYIDKVNVKQWLSMNHDKKDFEQLSTEEIVRRVQGIENDSNKKQDNERNKMFILIRISCKTVLAFVKGCFLNFKFYLYSECQIWSVQTDRRDKFLETDSFYKFRENTYNLSPDKMCVGLEE